ncbi:MAG: glycoside hydrolase family 13 protein [Clostridiales bacterium]|jgi:glycosidase|nr:glycoside hydrolase family 13 protein [Clostridiales bacterium]
MRFLFNSREALCKSPFGAVRIYSSVRFNFPFEADAESIIYGVSLIVKKYTGETVKLPMSLMTADKVFFEFSTDLILSEEGIYFYYFEIYTGSGTVFCGRGKGGAAVCASEPPAEQWQLTVYGSYPEKPHPLSGGIIYHVFADRFCKGGYLPSSVKKHSVSKEWNELPTVADPDGVFRANDFYGGNLRGIADKLDYIASLGVNAIYLSPIFEAASNHRYDTGDYFKIDPMLGDEKELKNLIDEADKRGIYIMMDGVFNHTGADSRYFNKFGNYDTVGAYQSAASEYYDWYTFKKFPDKYDCWWGITVVPTLNKSHSGVRKLVGDVVSKWISFGIKGLRLDVADELPKDYIYDIRRTVKSLYADSYLLGEVWEDASTKVSYGVMRPYLLGSQLDSVMNYPFKEAILGFVKNGDKNGLTETVMSLLENYPPYAVSLLMNIIDTHDTVRAVNYFLDIDVSDWTKSRKRSFVIPQPALDKAVKKLKAAALIQFTLPGIPSVYYGDEVGLTGFEDPLNRAAYPYGRENTELLEFYRRLGQFRKEFKDSLNSISFVDNADGLLVYKIAGNFATVVVNCTGQKMEYIVTRSSRDFLSGAKYPKNKSVTLENDGYFLLLNKL